MSRSSHRVRSGRRLLTLALAALAVVATPALVLAGAPGTPAPRVSAPPVTAPAYASRLRAAASGARLQMADPTFTTVGNNSYTVPTTGAITIRTRAGDGGDRINSSGPSGPVVGAGGSGAVVEATFAVEQGDVLTVVVGARGGSDGFTGGGGGGGSAVIRTRGSTKTLLLVSGAGGGAATSTNTGRGGTGGNGTAGGGGGASNGNAGGGGGFDANGASSNGGGGGGGAGTLAGGAGAGGTTSGFGGGGIGFGGGGGNGNFNTRGGGGGGYGGGNGGTTGTGNQGGFGGSSFVEASGTGVIRTDGTAGGGTSRNGEVVLSGPATQTPVTQAGLFNPSSAQGDGDGYRLLGVPVAGLTVTDLAGLNLVQGVPAGTPAATFPAQYPAAPGPNLYTAYTGTGGYTRPATTADVLTPGRGFFWRLYDRTIPANPGGIYGGGTSTSRELTGFQLSASGTPLTANVQTVFADNPGDDFQMLANPFARPLAVSGITATGGALQGGVVQAFNPNGNAYVLLMGTARLAVWQGVFAELVPTAPGNAVTVTYAYASTDTNAPPTFYGKGAASDEAPGVRFALAGTLASGAAVADSAALVRLLPDATSGWDALDASKLTPPTSDYALVAPVGERGGAAVRLAVDSRPLAAQTVPLALTTTGAGAFTLSWTATLPDGWTATLADTQTGTVTDVTRASSVSFTTAGAVDAERFVLTLAPRGATATEAPALALALTAPAPNPAGGRSSLVLTLPAAEHVRAVVIDALGREVQTLLDAEASGTVRLDVDAGRLAPGVYSVRVSGASFALARRLTVVR